MNLKTLKGQIEYCLQRYPDTRNSDIELTLEVWKSFYPSLIKQANNSFHYIRIDDLFELPREDSIKRIRAKFQNHPTKPKYLPDDPKVRKARHIQEEVWRNFLGYNPELRTV